MHIYEENKYNILAVDHGNYAIKTSFDQFTSGLREDSVAPAMGEEYISYKDGKWMLSENVPNYIRSKTEYENLFVQTLFAAARESKNQRLDLSRPVSLAVGLPPMHMRTEKKEIEKYFKERNETRLVYNGSKGIPLIFDSVYVYPQALSAIAYVKYAASTGDLPKPKFIDFPSLLIVDIGGGTADTIYIRDGKTVLSLCKSYELGTNFLIETIMNDMSMNLGITISSRIAEDILMGRPNIYTIDPDDETSRQVERIIRRARKEHVKNLLSKIMMDISDARAVPCIFEGGGAELLKNEIMSDSLAKIRSPKCEFLTDPHYNARGYFYLTDLQKRQVK